MDKLEIIKKLQESDLDKEVVFNCNAISGINKSSSFAQRLKVVSNYDCIDYTDIKEI